MKMEYKVVYSRRKSVAISVTREGEVLVKAPYRCSKRVICGFLKEKEEWIQKQVEEIQRQKAEIGAPLTEAEKKAYRELARRVLTEKAAYFAGEMGVTYHKISIREQKTRWGSCSSKGNLNFNWRLMLAPEEIQDYVVVHELAHRKEMNHSRAFYQVVEEVIPDYKERQKWLKTNGYRLWR